MQAHSKTGDQRQETRSQKPETGDSKFGFTIIELAIVIVLLGILTVAGVSFFAPMVNLFFYTPKQTRVIDIGNRLTDIIIEGDTTALGLRSLNSLSSAETTSISYTDADDNTVVFAWNNGTKRISRNVNGIGAEIMPPRSGTVDVDLDGATAGIIFKYYNAAGTLLSTPVSPTSQVERVQMDWILQTGSGQVSQYEGQITIGSGVDIKQF